MMSAKVAQEFAEFIYFLDLDPNITIDFSQEILSIYKGKLVEYAPYYTSLDKRRYLGYLRSMRSLFIENPDLLQDQINECKEDPTLKEDFKKAKESWEKFKTDEAEAFQKITPLILENDQNLLIQEIKSERNDMISIVETL